MYGLRREENALTVTDTWVRTRGILVLTSFENDVDILDIPVNDTLLRVHGGIEVILQVPGNQDYSTVQSLHFVAGLYTTLTTGGTLQHPATNQNDFAPPLQRWLFWEELFPNPAPNPAQALPDARREYHYVPSQNPLDIKAQVKATTAISLHLAMSATALPQAAKEWHLWYWFSMLRSGT